MLGIMGISVLFFVLFVGHSVATAGMMPPPALDPKDYRSPSGAFILRVDPSDMYGRGPAEYRVTRNGTLVWSGEKPFTLYDAGITDSGIVGGYAYTHGLGGFARKPGERGLGEFHVVIMRATGELILDEVIERTHSRFLHEFPNPAAKAILVDGRNSQMVIVISDEDVNRRQDRRWTYQLSSGRLLSKSTSGPNVPPASHPAEPQAVPLPAFPGQPLTQAATFSLGDAQPPATRPIRDITCFDADHRGRIGFIRRDHPQKNTFVLSAPDGKILYEGPLAIPDGKTGHGGPKIAWLSGNQWVIVASEIGVGGKASAWKLDVSRATFDRIEAFESPAISEIVGLPDGGFVVLATRRFKYSMEDALIAFDQAGKSRWQIKQGQHQDESALFSPRDLTITGGGQIAVIDGIRHSVQFFSTNGAFVRTINLEKGWRREPNYLAAITADKDGGVLIQDFRGSPPVVRMNAEGNVIAEFVPKYPDGRIIDVMRGFRVDPSGRVWACDGESLTRLGDNGVADLTLGSPPSTEKLNKIVAVTIDQSGHLYAVDDRTGAVHVYDETGTPLRVCKPDVTDFTNQIWQANVAAAPDGTVFLSAETTRVVHFAPDSRRLGVKQFALDSVTQHWHPFSNGTRILIIGYHDAYIVDWAGQVIRTIQRRPDRTWLKLPHSASMAPDGSFAIVTGGGHFSRKPWQVHLYTSSGDPIRTITMPGDCVESCFAYTGKVLATRTDQEICLFSDTGEPLLKFDPAIDGFANIEKQRWLCFSTLDGRELWYVCPGQKSVTRFALPL